jgi:regulator of PEP synthase PpsR (kinase-PPPase family)
MSALFTLLSDTPDIDASALLRAALAACGITEYSLVLAPVVQSRREVATAYEAARQEGAMVAHLLTGSTLRQVAHYCSRHLNVPSVDLIGPSVMRLMDLLNVQAENKPGLFRQINEDYFRRIEAIEFAVAHDDGLRPYELHQAEIILTGISRTSKTPLCMYMGSRGWLAANVPLVLGSQPPHELFAVDARKVIALTIRPERLSLLRHARLTRLGMSAAADYADLGHVREELRYAQALFAHGGWTVLDVTSKSIEESANDIIQILREQAERPPASRSSDQTDAQQQAQ